MNGRDSFTVKMKVADLLTRLKDNRDLFVKTLAEAEAGYHEAIGVWISDQQAAYDKGEEPELHCRLTEPHDHTDDYEQMIALFTDAVNEEIEITTEQHRAYVQNKWDWMEHAKHTMRAYTMSADSL